VTRTLRLKKRVIGTAFFFVLSVALVIALIRQITLEDVKRLAFQLNGAEFAVLCGLYLLMAYFRGIRLGYIIRENNHLKMTAIAAIHAFLNLILPFRLGELSLPFLIKVFAARGLGAGSLSLVVVRIYDAVSIAALSILSLLVVDIESSSSAETLLWIGAFAMMVGSALVFRYLASLVKVAAAVACGCLGVLGRPGQAMATRLRELAGSIGKEIDALDARQKYLFLPASSIVVTLLTYTMFYLVMVFMGIDIGFFLNMLASLGDLLTTFLPNALGSFGTLEAGWAAGYVLCGVSKADAIATGFIMHGIILLSGFVLSVCGFVYLLARRRSGREAGT